MRFARAITLLACTTGFASLCSAQVPLRVRLDSMSKRFDAIDSALARIEQTDSIDATADRIDALLDAYSREARGAFNAVMVQMRAYNESKGTQGSLNAAVEFENVVRMHRLRADTIAVRMASIDGGIRSGRIKLSRSLIQGLTPVERQQFRRSLSPRADSMYRTRLGPVIFPTDEAIRHMTDTEWYAARTTTCRPASDVGTRRGGLFAGLVAMVVPTTAYAAEPKPADIVAAQCYAVCSASFGWACATCIVQAGSTAINAWNQLSRCKSNCGTCHWYTPWRCACRAYCWAVFLVTLG